MMLNLKKSGGNRCCFSKCGCSSTQCRGLTFHQIPAAGKSAEQDKWRSRLIYLASRSDDLFNADKAKICSRHFTDDCFIYGPSRNMRGRRLKFGAEPTLHLPKSFASIAKYTRKPPIDRSAEVPEAQGTQQPHYGSFEDLRKALPQEVTPPWCLREDPSKVRIVLVNKGNVQVEVTIQAVPETEHSSCMVALVRIFGIPAPRLQCHFVDKNLRTLLHELCEMLPCKGVTNPEYQDLAALCDGTDSRPYYRHITNTQRENGNFLQESCIRSRDCRLLLPKSIEGEHVCKGCIETERVLKKRVNREKSRELASLKTHDPLHGMSAEQFKEVFKMQRAENKKLTGFRETLQVKNSEW